MADSFRASAVAEAYDAAEDIVTEADDSALTEGDFAEIAAGIEDDAEEHTAAKGADDSHWAADVWAGSDVSDP